MTDVAIAFAAFAVVGWFVLFVGSFWVERGDR